MAANYWNSSHCKEWIFKKDQITDIHKRDRKELNFSADDVRRVTNYYSSQIQLLGKRITVGNEAHKGLRQRVIATAMVYFKRFYLKNNFVEFCPKLTAPTCLYIASKVEECTTQAPAYRFEKELKRLEPSFPYTANHILECEFFVLEVLNFHLIVYHPYRPLLEFVKDSNSTPLLETAWNIINDSYFSDACHLSHPHIIALGCLYLAAQVCGVDLREWFAELNVDMKEVWTAVSEISDYYESLKTERTPPLNELLHRLPKFPQFF